MADTSDKESEALLRAFIKVGETLRQVADACRSSPAVSTVQTSFDFRDYSGRLTFEACTDAELRTGSGLSWWFELSYNGPRWNLNASVNRVTGSGQDTVLEFADFEDSTLEGALDRFDAILIAMRQSVDKVLSA